jgi:hypothetical protein
MSSWIAEASPMRVFQDLRLEQLDMHPAPEGSDEGVVRRAATAPMEGAGPGSRTFWLKRPKR